MKKSLKDISWLVSESEYRKDPALSYSTLAKFEREGFQGLSTLFDKVESPSLQFGSLVDTLITGTEEEFNNQFMVAQLDSPLSDTLVHITKRLFNLYKEGFHDIRDISDELILEAIQDIQWNNHWLPKTRVKKIKEDCTAYYKLLYIADNRTIISSLTYQDALNCVDKLKSAPSTRFYFEQDNPFDGDIERLYQLKFKATLEGIDYRIMADELIVFHDKKLIVPVDLKTTSKQEYDFPKSFVEWCYMIQAQLYWLVIRHNLDKDNYFKDFKLADYKFIVINKKSLNPLVWTWKGTTNRIDTVTKDGRVIRHPLIIGSQLRRYLDERPTVPDGIDLIKPNELEGRI